MSVSCSNGAKRCGGGRCEALRSGAANTKRSDDDEEERGKHQRDPKVFTNQQTCHYLDQFGAHLDHFGAQLSHLLFSNPFLPLESPLTCKFASHLDANSPSRPLNLSSTPAARPCRPSWVLAPRHTRHVSRYPGPNLKPNFFDFGLRSTEPTNRYRYQTEFRAVEFGLGQSFDLCFFHTTNLAPILSMTSPSSSLHPSHPSHDLDLKTSTWCQPRARG